MKIVVDAFAWIEFFLGSKKGKKVKEILEQSDEVLIPDTVIAEVARKYHREGVDEATIRSRLETIVEASDVVSIDDELALEAAKCYAELLRKAKKTNLSVPSLFDAIVLATCRLRAARALTGDEHFKNLAETLWLE